VERRFGWGRRGARAFGGSGRAKSGPAPDMVDTKQVQGLFMYGFVGALLVLMTVMLATTPVPEWMDGSGDAGPQLGGALTHRQEKRMPWTYDNGEGPEPEGEEDEGEDPYDDPEVQGYGGRTLATEVKGTYDMHSKWPASCGLASRAARARMLVLGREALTPAAGRGVRVQRRGGSTREGNWLSGGAGSGNCQQEVAHSRTHFLRSSCALSHTCVLPTPPSPCVRALPKDRVDSHGVFASFRFASFGHANRHGKRARRFTSRATRP